VKSKHSNLYLRLLTASIGIPAVLALVYLSSPLVLRWVFLFLAVRTAFEFARLFQTQAFDYAGKAWVALCLIITALTFSAATGRPGTLAIALLSVGLIAAAVLGTVGLKSAQERATGSLNALFVVTYSTLTWLALWFLAERSRDTLMIVLVGAWMSDSGAFFIGRRWGKHKMAPLISPKKTWEGAVGGFIFSVIGVFLFELYRSPVNNWAHLACIAPALAFTAQIGDLFKSIFKRQAGVKDAGTLLPGHGGLIDRIDSVLLSGILVWALLSYFHAYS
jgi:phosphatidate cytidylyltransferase